MQAISTILDAQLQSCFPFIDNFFGFTYDISTHKKATQEQLKKKQKGNLQTYPIGCNVNPDECNETELMYVLPESQKQGIVFYDNLKIVGNSIDLECDVNQTRYAFDIVVWINTNKVVFTNNEFCYKNELMYNHFVKCLNSITGNDLTLLSVGIYAPYFRSPWKFTDCVKYLNSPYIAFRMPIQVLYNVCAEDLPALNYTIDPNC